VDKKNHMTAQLISRARVDEPFFFYNTVPPPVGVAPPTIKFAPTFGPTSHHQLNVLWLLTFSVGMVFCHTDSDFAIQIHILLMKRVKVPIGRGNIN